MNTLTRNRQWLIGGLLLIFMMLTRSDLLSHLQDASWAIFFLVGFYLRSYLGFPIFWIAAFAIDLFVIKGQGGDNYCYTPAYPFLIPAYASLWFAGHWFAKHYREDMRGATYFIGAALVSIVVCFTVSNLGFYLFSNRLVDMNILQYSQTVAKYLPFYIQTTLLYLGIVAVIHLLISQVNKQNGYRHT
ncbi:MAG: hypothetical protein V3U78_05775 [Thiotrichaceae bacterium]